MHGEISSDDPVLVVLLLNPSGVERNLRKTLDIEHLGALHRLLHVSAFPGRDARIHYAQFVGVDLESHTCIAREAYRALSDRRCDFVVVREG
jgi:hypothetical protein